MEYCSGIVRGKKDELLELANNFRPAIIALQETKLWTGNKFEIAGFNMERKDGHFNHTPHGGVGLLIHSDTPYEVSSLTTNIQAIAIRINIGQLLTICNVYISGTCENRGAIKDIVCAVD